MGHPAPVWAREILGYFVRNPHAADTLEGVARWRLMEARVQRGIEEVDEALRWLVSEGWLRLESAAGAEPVFRLNDDRRGAACQFALDDPFGTERDS